MSPAVILIVVLLVLILIALLYIIFNINKAPEQSYQKELKKIIATYQEILVKIEKVPRLLGRTFIQVDDIESLILIEQESRKPLYYIEGNNCTDFFVITKEEVCTYTIKNNDKIISPLEAYIKESEENMPKTEQKILDDIENTTIIKISDGSVYKVSPLRVDKGQKRKVKIEEDKIKEELLLDEEEDEPVPSIQKLDYSYEDELMEEMARERARVKKEKEDRAKKYLEKKKKESRKQKSN
jgi:hypothetical protein